jgi:hypothetical protein
MPSFDYLGGDGGSSFDERFLRDLPPAMDLQTALPRGIEDLQRTLQQIDRATGGGSTLTPQDRNIPYSPFERGAAAIPFTEPNPFTGLDLPLEIAKGGSPFQAGEPAPPYDPSADFIRSMRGNAPAYPAGVVQTSPLPDLTNYGNRGSGEFDLMGLPPRAADHWGGRW